MYTAAFVWNKAFEPIESAAIIIIYSFFRIHRETAVSFLFIKYLFQFYYALFSFDFSAHNNTHVFSIELVYSIYATTADRTAAVFRRRYAIADGFWWNFFFSHFHVYPNRIYYTYNQSSTYLPAIININVYAKYTRCVTCSIFAFNVIFIYR